MPLITNNNDVNNNTSCKLDLNTKLEKYLPLTFIPSIIGDIKKKFITTLYDANGIIMRGEFIIIGSYSKEKNVWIWSDQSPVLHKKMVKAVIDLRATIINNMSNVSKHDLIIFKQFIETPYSIMPISTLFDNLCMLETFVGQKIITDISYDIMDVYIITNILLDNTF
jgi:hypothetical protein